MAVDRIWNVYLSGEIHSDWRQRIADGVRDAGLPAELLAPVTDHAASDDVGAEHPGRGGRAVLARPQGRRRQRGPYPDAPSPRGRGRGALRRQVQAVERRVRGGLRGGARKADRHASRRRPRPTRSRRSTGRRWPSPRRPSRWSRRFATRSRAEVAAGAGESRPAKPPETDRRTASSRAVG